MAETYEELTKKLSKDELIKRHDEFARRVDSARTPYIDELRHRELRDLLQSIESLVMMK